MAGSLWRAAMPLAVMTAIFSVMYQVFQHQDLIQTVLFTTLGLGRQLQHISEFPYQCRRIYEPELQACEDMWLSESTRQLFFACSEPLGRKAWLPNVGRLNATGRSLTDSIVAMNIDSPKGDGYEYRALDTGGTVGDGSLILAGFTAVDAAQGLNFFVVNNQPSVDAAGNLLDNSKSGGDPAIERFVLTPPESSELKHVKRFSQPQIASPNRVAAVGKNAFYFTNDHGPNKVGLKHSLAPFRGAGEVVYCSTAAGCKIVVSGLSMPNGLIRDQNTGLVYVPSTSLGNIKVYQSTTNMDLEQVGEIQTPYPLDNLHQDAKGDIYAAAFPKFLETGKIFDDPLNASPPSTVLRIKRKEGDKLEWEWEKVLEDGSGEILPAATTVVHDAKTGRLFLSSVTSPFIAVCEPR